MEIGIVGTPASGLVGQAHSAIAHLGRLTQLYQQRRQQLAESVGLTDREWGVLEKISTEHFMPSLFARQQESTPAAVSKIIRQLVDKDLVSVSVSRGDARHRDYVLTARGKRVLQRLARNRRKAIENIWLQFSSTELKQFCAFAERLTTRLEGFVDPATPKDRHP